MYLKHTSNENRYNDDTKGAPGSNCMQNDSWVIDGVSDDDLLASNFDRISKILPNHDQLPDYNGSPSGSTSNNQNLYN